MVRWVDRNSLDEEKYNHCIDKSVRSLTYGYSWYLDVVCDNWGAYVWNDYDVVMPIPFRKKYFISYVHPPLWILELGLFYQNIGFSHIDFYEALLEKFRFVELRLNAQNIHVTTSPKFESKYFQQLSLNADYDGLYKSYRSDRKKDLKKAIKFELKPVWLDDSKKLIALFKDNVGRRTPEIKKKDYENLEQLINTCVERNTGEVLSIYQGDQLVASGFFLKHQKTITILCSSTDFSNRNNGANTFLIDTAIQKYLSDYETFNFGGSSMASIAKYFFSFGAEEVSYPFLSQKRLPAFVQFLRS